MAIFSVIFDVFPKPHLVPARGEALEEGRNACGFCQEPLPHGIDASGCTIACNSRFFYVDRFDLFTCFEFFRLLLVSQPATAPRHIPSSSNTYSNSCRFLSQKQLFPNHEKYKRASHTTCARPRCEKGATLFHLA